MNLLLTFISRLCDTAFGASKTMLIQRNKFLLAGLCVFASDMFYFTVTKIIVSSTIETMIIAAVAGSIGCSLAVLVGDKLSKDKIYINTITSYDNNAIRELSSFLSHNNIQHNVCDTQVYCDDIWKINKTVVAYANTKHESKLIDSFLSNNIYNERYNRTVHTG